MVCVEDNVGFKTVCFEVKQIELLPAYVIILTSPYSFIWRDKSHNLKNKLKEKIHGVFFGLCSKTL